MPNPKICLQNGGGAQFHVQFSVSKISNFRANAIPLFPPPFLMAHLNLVGQTSARLRHEANRLDGLTRKFRWAGGQKGRKAVTGRTLRQFGGHDHWTHRLDGNARTIGGEFLAQDFGQMDNEALKKGLGNGICRGIGKM